MFELETLQNNENHSRGGGIRVGGIIFTLPKKKGEYKVNCLQLHVQ